MAPVTTAIALQTPTPTPEPGLEGLVDYGAIALRVGWFLAGFLVVAFLGLVVAGPLLSRAVRRRNDNNPTVQEAISRYFRLFVLLLAVFVGAGIAGYSQFLADSALVVAAVTLVVGVAGQAVLGSIVSGLALVFDPEFNIGNYIEWESGEGTIQSITLRVTRVQTPNGKLVTIPNTMLTEQAITRPYGRKRYRVVEHVGLAYEDDVGEAMEHLREAAVELEGTLADPAPTVYLDELGSDAVVLRVHYWLEDPHRRNVFTVRSTYAQAVKSRLDAAGITISPASQRELQGRIEVEETA